MSIPGGPDSILRLVKGAALPAASSPRVVGIDDWSWKRRLRYGTLICDLERGRPIDVLPDREVKTVSAWFEQHPTVEIVSRDRSSEYAAAIKKGAPQALQVADLWHLGKNLADLSTRAYQLVNYKKRLRSSGQELTERMLTMGCFSGLFAHYPVLLLRNHNRVRHPRFPLLALLVKMQAWYASRFHLLRVSTPQPQVPCIGIP